MTWSFGIAGLVRWVADIEGSVVMPMTGGNMNSLSNRENHPEGLN